MLVSLQDAIHDFHESHCWSCLSWYFFHCDIFTDDSLFLQLLFYGSTIGWFHISDTFSDIQDTLRSITMVSLGLSQSVNNLYFSQNNSTWLSCCSIAHFHPPEFDAAIAAPPATLPWGSCWDIFSTQVAVGLDLLPMSDPPDDESEMEGYLLGHCIKIIITYNSGCKTVESSNLPLLFLSMLSILITYRKASNQLERHHHQKLFTIINVKNPLRKKRWFGLYQWRYTISAEIKQPFFLLRFSDRSWKLMKSMSISKTLNPRLRNFRCIGNTRASCCLMIATVVTANDQRREPK